MSQLDLATKKMSQLNLGFNRKAWIKKYQKRRVTCLHCGKSSLVYKLRRHQRSLKCVHARLVKITL